MAENKAAAEIQELLQEFVNVLFKPKGLPPPRTHDCCIPTVSSASLANVRHDGYPHIQKMEIEKQVIEMLTPGIIQQSHSPYAAPMLLVKEDVSQRFCVERDYNYRQISDSSYLWASRQVKGSMLILQD